MTDLREQCKMLQALGSRGENPKARQVLEDALRSKWDGVQITAARSLLRWGDKRSVDLVKERLESFALHPQRDAAISTLAMALAPAMSESDMPWAVDFYFNLNRSNPYNRHHLSTLFSHLPKQAVVNAVEAYMSLHPGDHKGARTLLDDVRRFG